MALFWKYIRQHGKVILATLLFCVIFALVFALYHLPLGAALYPTLLCGLIGILFLALDFVRTKRKHAALERLSQLTAAMMDELPRACSMEEEDYQAVIRALQSEVAELESASSAKYRDMMDYYTIWIHQIKTPIASMRLNLQNQDTPASRKLQGDLFRIEQYVEMALTFLRLDSTSNDYVFQECSLDPLIRQAVRKFSHEFIDRKISLQYEPIEMSIVTDEKWLSFVLEQILSNALKYTREGSVKIYVQEPNTLCIEDTGIGIAPEDVPRIFEKGYTGHNGRSDKKASGIGAYLCKRICDNLGIGICAKSQVGKGTVILLQLDQHGL